jgi:hypothetical protein
MVVVKRHGFKIGIRVKKKLGVPLEYGDRWYGKFEYGYFTPLWGIYQMRKRARGSIIVREKFYSPKDQTQPLKVARQLVFAAAILGWQGLTDEQKANYNKRAIGKNTQGYNIYLKEYLLSH